jgi:hypothetical protein
MSPDEPRNFREVAIFYRQLRDAIKTLKEEDLKEVKDELEAIKASLKRLVGIIFTAIIGPVIVAIIIAYMLPVHR